MSDNVHCEKILSRSEIFYGFIRIGHCRELFPSPNKQFSLEFEGERLEVRVDRQFRMVGIPIKVLDRVFKVGDAAVIEKKGAELYVLKPRTVISWHSKS